MAISSHILHYSNVNQEQKLQDRKTSDVTHEGSRSFATSSVAESSEASFLSQVLFLTPERDWQRKAFKKFKAGEN